jgi:hypothetical protein
MLIFLADHVRDSEGSRTRCVPDRTVNRGNSRLPTDGRKRDLTCAWLFSADALEAFQAGDSRR